MTPGQTPAETGSKRAGLNVIANPCRGPSHRGLSVACGEGVSSGPAELVAAFVEGHLLEEFVIPTKVGEKMLSVARTGD